MSANTVTGLLVNIDGTTAVRTLAVRDGSTLDALYDTLDARTVDCLTIGALSGDEGAESLDAWIDDEGRFTSVPNHLAHALNAVASRADIPAVFGPVLYLGHDGNGETVSLPADLLNMLAMSAEILARRESIRDRIASTLSETAPAV